MEIRELHPDERRTWLRLRELLWPGISREELVREQQEILADPARNAVLVAASPGGELVGFVEVALRDWAEGCNTRPVGYVEAWYMEPDHRRSGVGRRLMDAAERWAASRGCTEMGSDTDPENEVSRGAHRALGYAEVGQVILFSKRIAR